MSVAENLVQQFQRMVNFDGGKLTLLGVEGNLIRIAYKSGTDPTCEDGVCVLPHLELQALMSETLARRDPNLQVRVEPVN